MAAAADTTYVEGKRGEQKQALAAGATRKQVHLVNVSGNPVQVILASETLPYHVIGTVGEESVHHIDGDAAQLAINLRCDDGPLAVYCTEVTA